MSLDLGAIKARAEAASPGPWEARAYRVYVGLERIIAACWRPWGPITGAGSIEADAGFIAHARSDVPALVAEVETLRSLVYRHNRRVGPYFIGQWTDEINHVDPCDCDLDEEEAGDRCMAASDWVYGVFVDGGAFAPRLIASLPRDVPAQDDVVHVGQIHEAAHAVVDTFTTADLNFMHAHADAVAALAKAIDLDLNNMWERS